MIILKFIFIYIYIFQVITGTKKFEVTSQVLLEVTLRVCSGETIEGLVDANYSSDSPELSASPTGS